MRGTAAEPWDQRHLQAEATQGPVASRDKGESIRYITAALYVLVCVQEWKVVSVRLAVLGEGVFEIASRILTLETKCRWVVTPTFRMRYASY